MYICSVYVTHLLGEDCESRSLDENFLLQLGGDIFFSGGGSSVRCASPKSTRANCRVFNNPISDLDLCYGILICKLKYKLGLK